MFSVYAIADRDQYECSSDWLRAIERVAPALKQPGRALQLRWKRAAADREEATMRARALLSDVVTLTNGFDPIGFSGEHLPEARLVEGAARKGSALIAASVHSREVLRHAESAGVQFVLYGPVFPPGSHPGQAVGIAALREFCEASRLPVVAVGGVTPERVEACLSAGAFGVAAVTGIFCSGDPAGAMERYAAAVAAYSFRRRKGEDHAQRDVVGS